ncbi:hypothetical protein [Saccharicrinis aurantiacus]|uniref:hypothetical protein n=1 Tax=Saccharicrinis aurantiacus TaxID=1849719 RepID=UPI00094F758B|nr:hypothetical protein [Saccharicrinis aurantiacus]
MNNAEINAKYLKLFFFTEANKYRSGKPTHTPSKAYPIPEQALPGIKQSLTKHVAMPTYTQSIASIEVALYSERDSRD